MISNHLLKGTLQTIILKLLSENPRMYGYEITKKVEELSNGKIMLTYGALYPVLHKLEAENLVTTEKEMIGKRARIYYQLTDTGKKKTRDLVDEFIEFVKVMGYIINPYPSIA